MTMTPPNEPTTPAQNPFGPLLAQIQEIAQNAAAKSAPVAKMPAAIAKAMITVMGKIDTVQRDEQHGEGESAFSSASVDAIFDKTRVLCASHGILPMPFLVSLTKEGHLDRYEYQFVIYHESGEEFSDPRWRQVIDVVPEGPWTSGKVQSLAMKYCLKNVFQISTGEGDGLSKAQVPDVAGKTAAKGKAKAEEPSGPSARAQMLAAAIGELASQADLDVFLHENGSDLATVKANKLDKALIDTALLVARKRFGGTKPQPLNDAAKGGDAAKNGEATA